MKEAQQEFGFAFTVQAFFQNLVLGLQSKNKNKNKNPQILMQEQYFTPYFKSNSQGLRHQNLPTVQDIQTK